MVMVEPICLLELRQAMYAIIYKLMNCPKTELFWYPTLIDVHKRQSIWRVSPIVESFNTKRKLAPGTGNHDTI